MLGLGNYIFRLVPANPILLRVVAAGGKRKRDLMIRCAYLGILLFLVIFLLLSSSESLASASLSGLSKQSAEIFWWMSYVQLLLVALLAPVFTAGAITQEKDSQTYDILLATPLTNGQIVLGSLLSRLFFVVALLISGIPIFSITQIFGGVAISAIVTSFLIAIATAFVTGALAMAIAVFKVGTRRTIFSFYVWIGLYLAVPLVLEQMGFFRYDWQFNAMGKPTSHISWFAGLHPFLALRIIFGDPAYRPPDPALVQKFTWPLSWYLSSPHSFYITFMMLLSFVLVMPSIVMLRRLAQSTQTIRMWIMRVLRLSSGDKTRNPRHVWTNPIAWREAKTRASASRAVALRYGFMLAGIAGAVILIIFSSRRQTASSYIAESFNPAQNTVVISDGGSSQVYRIQMAQRGTAATQVRIGDQNASVEDLREGMVVVPGSMKVTDTPKVGRVLSSIQLTYPQSMVSLSTTRQFLLAAIMVELAIILLILTQSAASTVTREKEDGTLDLLLSTPITSRYYVWGKLRGLVSFVLPLVAVPVASIFLFVLADLFFRSPVKGVPRQWTVFPEAVLILPGTLVMVSAFAAILGMQMSLRCRKTVVAVMSSVGIVALVSGLLFACGTGAATSNDFGPPGIAIGCFSPFTLMALLVAPSELISRQLANPSDAAGIRILIFFFGWIAAIAYGIVVWAMYKSMVRNFDMTIRKQAT